MSNPDLTGAVWRKSTRSDSNGGASRHEVPRLPIPGAGALPSLSDRGSAAERGSYRPPR